MKGKGKKSTFLDPFKQNFDLLKNNAANLALLECKDIKTGEMVATLVLVHEDGESMMLPVARMLGPHPMWEVVPPKAGGGFEDPPDDFLVLQPCTDPGDGGCMGGRCLPCAARARARRNAGLEK